MKKFTAVFLMFAIMTFSTSLYGNNRKGAEIIIKQKDGWHVKGELIAVKDDALLLMHSTTGSDVSILFSDIDAVIIDKKSKAWMGGALGLVAGAATGALLVSGSGSSDTSSSGGWDISFGPTEETMDAAVIILTGIVGLGLGVLAGTTAGVDMVIELEGLSPTEIEQKMYELRRKARIPDYN